MPHEEWRTGPPRKHQSPVVKPSGRQIIRQVLILLLMVIVWGGMLAIWAGATASSDLAVASVVTPTPLSTVFPSPTVIALLATATATTAPATATPQTTSTRPAATATATTAPATATPEATSTQPAATATSTATSTPTVSPADTPVPIEPPATPSQADSNTVSFARDVQPIFNRVCVKCHGGEEVKEGLVLKTYVEIMAGSDNGPVIAPGDPANSLLIDLITRGKMPKQGPKLLPGQIRIITDWVTAGAVNN